jgi:hypothetical protein
MLNAVSSTQPEGFLNVEYWKPLANVLYAMPTLLEKKVGALDS